MMVLVGRRGYADAEIEAVFAKYDADGDNGLNLNEQGRMQRDLEEQTVGTAYSIVSLWMLHLRLLLADCDLYI